MIFWTAPALGRGESSGGKQDEPLKNQEEVMKISENRLKTQAWIFCENVLWALHQWRPAVLTCYLVWSVVQELPSQWILIFQIKFPTMASNSAEEWAGGTAPEPSPVWPGSSWSHSPAPATTGCHQAELEEARKREKRRNLATFKVSIRLAQNILTDNVQDIS